MAREYLCDIDAGVGEQLVLKSAWTGRADRKRSTKERENRGTDHPPKITILQHT